MKLKFKKGLKFGNWELVEKLGEGGNSCVWKTINNNTKKECALKLPKFRFIQKKKIYEVDKYKLRRFEREISIHTKVSDIKISGTLPVIDYNLPKKIFEKNYISLEEYPWLAVPIAEPLKIKLENEDLHNIVHSFIQIAETLEQLHKINIIHRDIKPENLLFYDGRPCLNDFGIAKALDESEKNLTKTGTKIGPNLFIAPEMRRGQVKGLDQKKADVYSFGVTLWAFITKEWTGFEGEYNKEVLSIRNYIKNSEDILYEQLDEIIKKCTSYESKKRPNMSEVVEDLRKWEIANREKIKSKWISKVKNMLPKYSSVKNIKWTNKEDIVSILKELINLNHILFPDRGGLDMTDIKYSQEKDMIDIYCGGFTHRLKVDSLSLEYFEEFPDWSYFILKTSEIEPFDKRFKGRYYEPLTEIKLGLYSIYECGEWNNFDGKDLPKEAKQIVRILKGKIAIFCKFNEYIQEKYTNLNSYDALHEKLTEDEFRKLIFNLASKINNVNKFYLKEKNSMGINYKFVESKKNKEGRKLNNKEVKIIKEILDLLEKVKDNEHKTGELVFIFNKDNFEKTFFSFLEKMKKEEHIRKFLENLNIKDLILIEAVMYGGKDYLLYENNHPLETYINYSEENIDENKKIIIIDNILSKGPLIDYLRAGLEAFT